MYNISIDPEYYVTNSVMKLDIVLICFLGFLAYSCKNPERKLAFELVQEWVGKQIEYPRQAVFTVYGEDTIRNMFRNSSFSIVSYVDSSGCMGCKLQLRRWNEMIKELRTITRNNMPIYFFLYPKNRKNLISKLKRDGFNTPVCIDENDSFNKLNHFPSDMNFQTFLLDKHNKVIAIGNPVLNPKIKELYLDIIQGKRAVKSLELTTAVLDRTLVELPAFDWQQEKVVEVMLTNTGTQPLVIDDAVSSCDCTIVEYSKSPVSPGNYTKLLIKYKAERPEVFYRTVNVYCNTKNSPLEIEIKGECK